jgi:hypothetical protein
MKSDKKVGLYLKFKKVEDQYNLQNMKNKDISVNFLK